jgi:hypothetical protein
MLTEQTEELPVHAPDQVTSNSDVSANNVMK